MQEATIATAQRTMRTCGDVNPLPKSLEPLPISRRNIWFGLVCIGSYMPYTRMLPATGVRHIGQVCTADAQSWHRQTCPHGSKTIAGTRSQQTTQVACAAAATAAAYALRSFSFRASNVGRLPAFVSQHACMTAHAASLHSAGRCKRPPSLTTKLETSASASRSQYGTLRTSRNRCGTSTIPLSSHLCRARFV